MCTYIWFVFDIIVKSVVCNVCVGVGVGVCGGCGCVVGVCGGCIVVYMVDGHILCLHERNKGQL